jgi:23S rRNA (uracil1939-C5)-methyltransferase
VKKVNIKPTENLIGTRALIEISDLNHDGEGVGRLGSLVVFVPGALPGEATEIEIVEHHKRYLQAKLIRINKESRARIKPPCPYFKDCGGCQLQHLDYQGQLNWKRSRVKAALSRIGNIKLPVLPTIGMNNPFRYRNKARIHFTLEEDRIRSGFYKKKSRQIIEIEDCLIQHPHNMLAIKVIRNTLAEALTRKEIDHQIIHDIYETELRCSFATGQVLITLGVKGKANNPVFKDHFTKSICSHLGDKLAGLIIKAGSNKKHHYQTLVGNPFIEEIIEPFHYRISPRSFFQVNPLQAKKLFKLASSSAGNPHTVFDLYCGTGNFALYLSRVATAVIGIDSEGEAIKDARENTVLNGINNINFTQMPIDETKKLLLEGSRPITVILDPPRGGCSVSLLEIITEIKPERIVYISCNPATLARDLGLLQQSGFQAIEAQPIDMFPQTSHVECVVLITK